MSIDSSMSVKNSDILAVIEKLQAKTNTAVSTSHKLGGVTRPLIEKLQAICETSKPLYHIDGAPQLDNKNQQKVEIIAPQYLGKDMPNSVIKERYDYLKAEAAKL